MKKNITIFTIFLLAIVGIHTAKAQDVESAKKELTKIFQESGYEVLELSPCKVYIKIKFEEDLYNEIAFAPNEAHWDVVNFGFRSDWRIIHGKEYYKGETSYYTQFTFSLGMQDEEFYSKIAEQLNILGGKCPEKQKEKEITESDLKLFVYAMQDINEKLSPHLETLKNQLSQYETSAEQLSKIYTEERDGKNIKNYSAVELKEMAKAKPFLKTFEEEYIKITKEYFESAASYLPQKEYEVINEKLSDPVFLEKAKKILNGK